jgi:tetratricopeptide (TPR) repeat protein
VRTVAFLLIVAVASSTDNPRAMQLLTEWVVIVNRHAAGERDAALAQIGSWNADDLEMMRAYIDALTEVPLDNPARVTRRRPISGNELAAIRERTQVLRAGGNFNEFRKRAAVLHTDTALLESLPKTVPAPKAISQGRRNQTEPAVDVMSSDGRVDSFEIANPHWQFAMDLLDALPAQPQRDPIVAQWYRGIGAYFAREHRFGDAFRHFERARKTVPDDAGVLFGEACLQETFGSPTQQNFVRVTTLPNGLTILGMSSPQTHFRRAQTLLTRALAAKPDFVDARLRLGRVLAQQRQYLEALPHFTRVITESTDPVLTYYAHMFAGESALALDRPSESRASYERALKAYPGAQSARLGLATALRAAGDREAAVNAVMTTLTIEPNTRDIRDDPWWQYYEGDAANVERLLQELRAPFTRARP